MPEHRVPQIGAGLRERRDRELSGRGTLSEASDLRKYEPHPVACLLPTTQLVDGAVIRAAGVLRGNEPLEVIWIASHRCPRPRRNLDKSLYRQAPRACRVEDSLPTI